MGKIITLELNEPHLNQQKVIDCDARFMVLMCGRRFGKSVVSQTIAVEAALQGKRVAYMTPTYMLARIFLNDYETMLPPSLVRINKTDLTIHFLGGGLIRFFTGERPDKVRGLWFDYFLIDEASFIPKLKEAWDASIRPTLTDKRGKGILLSTPKGKNDFYKFSLNENTSPDWKTFRFTSYDNPYIPADEIDAAGRELPEATFKQEYLASPQENADNPFGSAFIQKNIRPLSNKPPVCFGIDLAKSYDYTVITGLDEDCNVCHFERFQKKWGDTSTIILGLPNVPKLIDATGVGDPIVEGLQELQENIYGFKFTSGSKHELVLGLVAAVQKGEIGYPDGVYVSEMEIFEYTYTSTGVKYSAPDGLHDDAVLSLALARKCYVLYGQAGVYHFS